MSFYARCATLFMWLVLTSNVGASSQPQPTAKPVVGKAPRALTDQYGDSLPTGALVRLGTTRFRVGDFISYVTLSPDGKMLAILSGRRTIHLLDVAMGKELRRFEGDFSGFTELAFTPDGRGIAAVGLHGLIKLWGLATGKQLRQFSAPPGTVSTLSFSADGKFLASGSEGYGGKPLARVWEVATGKRLREFEALHNRQSRVALSPNGKLLAAWGEHSSENGRDDEKSRTIQLWDLAEGKKLHQFVAEGREVSLATFSPDGKILAVATRDAGIQTWDVTEGKLLRFYRGRRDVSAWIGFSPQAKTLAAASREGTVQFWETATGERLGVYAGPKCHCFGFVFTAENEILGYGIEGQETYVWDAHTGKPRNPAGGQQTEIKSMAFSADGKLIVASGSDRKVFSWDVTNGKEIRKIQLEEDELYPGMRSSFDITSVVLSPKCHYAVAAGITGFVQLFELRNGKEIGSFKASGGHHTSFAFSPDESLLAANAEGTVTLWRVATGEEIRILRGHSGQTAGLAFSPDGRCLASGCYYSSPDNRADLIYEIVVWDVHTGRECCRLRQPNIAYGVFAFSSDGKVLATEDRNRGIILWDTVTGKELRQLPPRRRQISPAFIFSQDGRSSYVASALREGADAIIQEVSLVSGQVRREFSGHRGQVSALSLSADGKILASGSSDTTVLLWDLTRPALEAKHLDKEPLTAEKPRPLRPAPRNTTEVTSLLFTPDGKTLISAGLDGYIRFWDPAQVKELRRIQAHLNVVYDLALSPDGKLLASAGDDQTIILWNPATAKEILKLLGHEEPVSCVAFSPDGKTLASGSYDSTIRLWDVATGKELRRIKPSDNLVTSVAFSRDGKFLAIGGIDPAETAFFKGSTQGDRIRLWNLATKVVQLSIRGHRVLFAENGKVLIAGGMYLDFLPPGKEGPTIGGVTLDGGSRISLWDVARKIERRRHDEYGTALAVSADGKLLASGWGCQLHMGGIVRSHGTYALGIHVWEVDTGKEIVNFSAPQGNATAIAFSPNKTWLAAGRKTGGVQLWRLPSQ